MLIQALISKSIPLLSMQDSIGNALQMMSDFHVSHLALADNEKYVGLVSEELLLQAPDGSKKINSIQNNLSLISVQPGEHFLKALQIAVGKKISVVPVVDEDNQLVGVVSYHELLQKASEFMNVNEPGGLIVLEMESNNYSVGEISRLVETSNAQVVQLNTVVDSQTGLLLVTIKLNKEEISEVVTTLQRHEYCVKYYFGEELYENELRFNYDNLMNYLKM